MDRNKFAILVVTEIESEFLAIEELLNPENKYSLQFLFVSAESDLVRVIDLQCDVIIYSLSLKKDNGFANFKLLMDIVKNTPVIVLADGENQNLAEAYLKSSAYDFIVKEKAGGAALINKIKLAAERNELLNSLSRLENQYIRSLDYLQDAVFICTEGKIVYANESAAILYGVKSKSEFIGRDINDYNLAEIKEAIEVSVKKNEIDANFSCKKTLFLPNRGEINADIEIFRVQYKNSPAFQINIRGVNKENKFLPKEKIFDEKYKRFYHYSTLGVFHTNRQGNFLDTNNSFAMMFGYSSKEELITIVKNAAESIYYEPGRRDEILKELEKSKDWYFCEVLFKRKNGSKMLGTLSIRKQINEKGEVEYYEGFVENITEKKKAEEQLKKESELNAQMAELASDILKAKSIEEITIITLEKARMLTNSKFGFVGYIDTKTGYLVIPTLTAEIWNDCRIYDKKYVFEKFTGLWGWVLIYKKPLLTNEPLKDYRSNGLPPGHMHIENFLSVPAMHNQQLVGQIALANSDEPYDEHDQLILERLASVYALGLRRIQAVKEAIETQEKFRLAFQYSNVGAVIEGLDKRIMRVNATFANMLGYEESQLLGRSFDELSHPDDIGVGADEFEQMLKGERDNFILNKRYLHKNGRPIWVFISSTLLRDSKNEPDYFITYVQDFTDKKEAEEKLKASLSEKEMLLRELYHRTKNNMQVICAMLGLESLSTKDENVVSIFKAMENRIQTMALVHQKLYQSQNLSKINMREYISDLTYLLYMSYNISSEKINMTLNVDDITVLIDTAIPCGLLINELVSNAFKYAFPDDKKGDVIISIKKIKDDIIELKVSDNGIGLPIGFDASTSETLGCKLLYTLAEGQLQGDVNYYNDNGVTCIITFRDNFYSERI